MRWPRPRTRMKPTAESLGEASEGPAAAKSGLPMPPPVWGPEAGGLRTALVWCYQSEHLLPQFGSGLGRESEKPLCLRHDTATDLWCVLFPRLQRGTTCNFSFLVGDLGVMRIHLNTRGPSVPSGPHLSAWWECQNRPR